MKNWKSVPHLFANGKFKAKTNFEKSVRIVGAEVFLTMDEEQETPVDEWEFLLDNNKKRPIEDCTLIARKIEDVTDEEIMNFDGGMHSWKRGRFDEARRVWKDMANHNELPQNLFLYFLSIGVYPFSDSTDVEYQPKLEE